MALINTTKGPMEEELLRKVEGVFENPVEHVQWVEYYDGDELVHRSVHTTIKDIPE